MSSMAGTYSPPFCDWYLYRHIHSKFMRAQALMWQNARSKTVFNWLGKLHHECVSFKQIQEQWVVYANTTILYVYRWCELSIIISTMGRHTHIHTRASLLNTTRKLYAIPSQTVRKPVFANHNTHTHAQAVAITANIQATTFRLPASAQPSIPYSYTHMNTCAKDNHVLK